MLQGIRRAVDGVAGGLLVKAARRLMIEIAAISTVIALAPLFLVLACLLRQERFNRMGNDVGA
jgi:hypothetical protein